MEILIILLSLALVAFTSYIEFMDKFISRKSLPQFSSKSKNISIMYMANKIIELERDIKLNGESVGNFCLEYDIERLRETITFLESF